MLKCKKEHLLFDSAQNININNIKIIIYRYNSLAIGST